MFWSICKSYALSLTCFLAPSQFIFLALQDRSGIDFVELVLPLLDSDFYSNSRKWGLPRAPSMAEDAICPPHPLSHFNPRKEKAYRLFIVHFSEVSFGIFFFLCICASFHHSSPSPVPSSDVAASLVSCQHSSAVFSDISGSGLRWAPRHVLCPLIPGHSWDVCIHICGARRAHVGDLKLGSRVSILIH